MKSLILICLILVIGCQRSAAVVIDPTFRPLVLKFEAIFDRPVMVNINFDTTHLLSNEDGKCHHDSPVSDIYIKKSRWDAMSIYAKEQLLFHELGHCVLGLSHNDTVITRNGRRMPQSIMYFMTFADTYPYHGNEFYYYMELKDEEHQ